MVCTGGRSCKICWHWYDCGKRQDKD